MIDPTFPTPTTFDAWWRDHGQFLGPAITADANVALPMLRAYAYPLASDIEAHVAELNEDNTDQLTEVEAERDEAKDELSEMEDKLTMLESERDELQVMLDVKAKEYDVLLKDFTAGQSLITDLTARITLLTSPRDFSNDR